jgi:pimeloyl-ACP methyl ester carboxylesterase
LKKRSKKLFTFKGRIIATMTRLVFGVVFLVAGAAWGAQPWLRLPVTPVLPVAVSSGVAAVDGVQLWHAEFGSAAGRVIILLHGGLANSNYWGGVIPLLAGANRVIVVDSRGHGRSGRNAMPIGYELMARDVVGLMDALHVQRASVVGWSDGAITGLEMALHYPQRLDGVFAFAANSDPSGVKDVRGNPVFSAFIARAAGEYKALSPTPDGFAAFDADIEKMWAREPNMSADTLRSIHAKVWIVDGDHDEAITRENTDHMAAVIPEAREMILPGVSHFACLQDPALFATAVQLFLAASQ